MDKVSRTTILSKTLLSLFWLVFIFSVLYPFLFKPAEIDSQDVSQIAPKAIPDFASISDVTEKKRAFFAYLLPEIKRQNELVMQERHFIMSIDQKIQTQSVISETQLNKLKTLAKKYKLKENAELIDLVTSLLKRVDIIPPELVLVQAANESAWGTSRFAQKGYNFFGLWCFKKGCGFVPKQRDDGLDHEVAKFKNLPHAVNTYVRNLNRHYAYEQMRTIRYRLRTSQQKITAEALVHGLMSYSERGQDYIEELLNMIRFNRKYMNV